MTEKWDGANGSSLRKKYAKYTYKEKLIKDLSTSFL